MMPDMKLLQKLPSESTFYKRTGCFAAGATMVSAAVRRAGIVVVVLDVAQTITVDIT
jgi:hypothetical protein